VINEAAGHGEAVLGVGWSQGAALINNVALTIRGSANGQALYDDRLQMVSLNSAPQLLFAGFNPQNLDGHLLNLRLVLDLPVDPVTGRRPGDVVSVLGPTWGTTREVPMSSSATTVGEYHDPKFLTDPSTWPTDSSYFLR